MERIRQRLLDETAGIAKSEARRREREGKKIGKQVQLEKIKERERSKKDMEDRLKGLKRSALPSLSLIIVSLLIFCRGTKNTKVRYTTRKRMTSMPLMSRWRMPSRTGDRRNARVGARREGAVCRDKFATRNLGLGAMGRGISKIHARQRMTLTGWRGEVRAACGVVVGVEVGAGLVGWENRVVKQRGVDHKVATCAHRLKLEDLARLYFATCRSHWQF